MNSIAPLPTLNLPMPAALPATDYSQMFRSIPDPAAQDPVAPGAPKVWGSVRLAAWSWAGIGDLGPVMLDLGWPASYAAADAHGMASPRIITSI